MAGEFVVRIFDVEHGACAIMQSPTGEKIAMIDSGHNDSTGWRPSVFIRDVLERQALDYLFVTNADQDHLSDLDGLWQQGVEVKTLHRNQSPPHDILRAIKQDGCPDLTNDIERFLQIHRDYIYPVAVPFNQGMAGVTCETFCNSYPEFTDTNNLSLVAFFTYGTFTICFPGDIEEAGWKALLKKPAFVAALQRTTILVASHHGRRSGFCADLFQYFTPQAVVISDKPIEHETQDVDYSAVVGQDGVVVAGQKRRRHVLTTRKDDDILFVVHADGNFSITTGRAHLQAAA